MTNPIRAAETLGASCRSLLEEVARMGDCIGKHTVGEITAISDRAAAWLQENPPGQITHPEPPAEREVADEELENVFEANCYTDDYGTYLMDAETFVDGARAAIALDRSRRAPVQPAEGEVGDEAKYLAKELRDQADDMSPALELFGLMHRAADLLSQRHPAPVPVSERLQQMEDLAADAVSALRYIEQSHGRLYGIGWDRVYEKADQLRPAHALPLPARETQP